MLDILFGSATFAATLRIATPLLLAAVGGSFGDKAGIFNIALESFMLTAAFASMCGSFVTGNPFIGGLWGILAGLLMALLFGLLVFHLGSNGLVVSIALNNGAWGFTTLLLTLIFHTRGSFVDSRIKSYPVLDLPFLRNIPFVNDVFNNQHAMVYVALIMVFVMWVVMYKTPFGLRIRSVGINAKAAQTAGVNVLKYKWMATLITGALVGLSGSVLPLGGVSMFSESMSAGRGFLAVAAIMIGKGNPLLVALSCLLFAYTDALTINLQNIGIPTQIVMTLPYLATVVVLVVVSVRNIKKLKANK